MKNIFLIFGVLFLLSSITKADEGVMPEPDPNVKMPDNLDGDGAPGDDFILPPQNEEPDFHDGDAAVDDSDVLVLTEATFDEAIKTNKYIMVEFYAPWCGHCKQLAPQYARAAKSLKTRDPPIPLAKVDATAETKLAERFEIQGYPTVKFFINGEPIEYTGGRTDLEIIIWIDKKTGPILKDVASVEDLDRLTASNDVVVVLFGDSTDSEATSVFKKVAYGFEDVLFALSLSDTVKAHFNVEAVNSVVLFKKFDEKRNDCNCEVNEDNVRNFVERNQFPTVMTFNDKSAEKIFGEGVTTLFLFLGKDVENGRVAREALHEVSEKLKGKILMCISSFTEELGQRLAEYIGLSDDETPVFKIIHPVGETGEVKKYNYEGELTGAGILKFYEDFTEGKIQPYFRSEPIPETNNEPVKVVVGKTFAEIVLDKSKDVMVEFYAPWCGHCKQLAPIYESIAKKLEGNPNILLAKVDATANEIEGVAIEGFPTLKFYPASDKVPVDFDGERTEESIIDFIKHHATLPWIEEPKKEDL